MNSKLYTNTSNLKGVIGLVATTILVSYAQAKATQIVDGGISLTKGLAGKLQQLRHGGKQEYVICSRDFDGKLYDTGKRIWK